MKKITFLLVAIMATMFCACSSDNDNAPENSQFIYADNSILISITRGPSTMVFKADNRVLDVNGDGLLDEIFSPYN